MKRWLAIALCVILTISLAACVAGKPTVSPAETENLAETETTTTRMPESRRTECTEAENETEPAAEPILERYNYTVDYHRHASLFDELYDSEIIRVADAVVDEFLKDETEIEIPVMTRQELSKAEHLLREMCPPFFAFAKLGLPENWNEEVTSLSWTYRIDAEQRHEQLEAFENEVNRYMDMLYENDTEAMRALIIFLEFGRNTDYDDVLADPDAYGISNDEYDARSNAFEVILKHAGVCYTQTEALDFLYLQAGLNATNVSTEGHAWTVAQIDGLYYYMDVTWTSTDEDVYTSEYFGITAENRKTWAGGFLPEETMLNREPIEGVLEVTDTRFSQLHGYSCSMIQSYEADHEKQIMHILGTDGCSFEFDMQSKDR